MPIYKFSFKIWKGNLSFFKHILYFKKILFQCLCIDRDWKKQKQNRKHYNVLLVEIFRQIYFYSINVSCESTRKKMQDMRSVFGCRGFVYECKFKIKDILKSKEAHVRSHFNIFSPSAIYLVLLVVFSAFFSEKIFDISHVYKEDRKAYEPCKIL